VVVVVVVVGGGFKFIQMKWNTLLQGEIIAKEKKYTENLKKSFPEPASQLHFH
jgi:hypothetical protein